MPAFRKRHPVAGLREMLSERDPRLSASDDQEVAGLRFGLFPRATACRA